MVRFTSMCVVELHFFFFFINFREGAAAIVSYEPEIIIVLLLTKTSVDIVAFLCSVLYLFV